MIPCVLEKIPIVFIFTDKAARSETIFKNTLNCATDIPVSEIRQKTKFTFFESYIPP